MELRLMTFMEAADRIGLWADRRLPAKPEPFNLDFTLEEACDGLCMWIAEDPERDIAVVPATLLRHLRARLLFATGAAMTRRDEIIGRVPLTADDDEILRWLFATALSQTRFPPEWRIQ